MRHKVMSWIIWLIAIMVVVGLAITTASLVKADLIIYANGQPYRLVSPGTNPPAYLPNPPRRDCDRDRGGNDNQFGWLVGGLLLGLFSNNQPSYPAYSPGPGYASPYQNYGGGYDPYASAYADAYQAESIKLERQRRANLENQAREAGREAARQARYGY